MTSEQSPVLKRHREEAARSTFCGETLPPLVQQWAETGDGVSPLKVTVYHAQSLANAEAAVHARYAPLVSAARASVEDFDACTGWDKLNNEALHEALKGLEE